MKTFLTTLAAAAAMSTVGAATPTSPAKLPEDATRNIVLVHSALVDGSSWRGVYDELIRDGYHVAIVAHGQLMLSADVAATQRVIDQQDGPVVLVGASYGGVIITEAGAHPKVRALVYVAAMQPEVGESLVDLAARTPSASKNLLPDTNGLLSLDPRVFHADFGADLQSAQAQFLAAGQMPLAVAAASTKVTVAAWHRIPTYGIVATEDRLISPALQRFMYTRGNDKITEIKASHAVFMSQPRAVALVIETAAKVHQTASPAK